MDIGTIIKVTRRLMLFRLTKIQFCPLKQLKVCSLKMAIDQDFSSPKTAEPDLLISYQNKTIKCVRQFRIQILNFALLGNFIAELKH